MVFLFRWKYLVTRPGARVAIWAAPVVRFGRLTSSPPQFGQVADMAAEQAGQKVHS